LTPYAIDHFYDHCINTKRKIAGMTINPFIADPVNASHFAILV